MIHVERYDVVRNSTTFRFFFSNSFSKLSYFSNYEKTCKQFNLASSKKQQDPKTLSALELIVILSEISRKYLSLSKTELVSDFPKFIFSFFRANGKINFVCHFRPLVLNFHK